MSITPAILPASGQRRPHGAYTYIATDILTGQATEEIPLVGVSYSHELGWGCRKATGSIPLFDRNLFKTDLSRRSILLACRKWRSGLYILRDGVVQWGGVITSVLPDDGDVVRLTAQGMLAYFGRRLITSDLTYGSGAVVDDVGVTWTGVGQLQIATALVAAAQSDPNGGVGVLLPTPGSSSPRDRTYHWVATKPVGEALTDLSNVDGGFELGFDAFADADGTPRVRLSLAAPTLGRAIDLTGLVIESPGSVAESTRWSDPQVDLASHVVEIGEGDGTTGLRSTAVSQAVLDAGYPRLDHAESRVDVSVQSTLDGHAAADLVLAASTLPVPEVTTLATDPPLGTYVVGDQLRYRETSPVWPSPGSGAPGLDVACRLVARAVTVPDDAGEERVVHTLNPAEAVIQ